MTPLPETFRWQCRDRVLELGGRTLVMGILNTTPDSFSDGGRYLDPDRAVERALRMVEDGADLIDIGGESTRPGAQPVPVKEEIRRTIPVVERLRPLVSVPLSIDTTKAEVARLALEAGADIVNDISALEADSETAAVVRDFRAGVVLMHRRGTPRTMQRNPTYADVVAEVARYLAERTAACEAAGIPRERIVIDPGIGFGKTVEHNLELLRALPDLVAACGRPLLLGASRKSFIGAVTGRENPADRLAGSLAVAAWAILWGVHILRVHDVIETCDCRALLDTLRAGESS